MGRERSTARALLAYQPVLLVFVSLLSDVLAASVSVFLVAAYVISLLARWWPIFLTVAFASSLAVVILLAPHVGYWAMLPAVPILYAVKYALEAVAPGFIAADSSIRRALSPMAGSLIVAAGTIALMATVVSSHVLAVAGVLLMLVLCCVAGIQYVRLGSEPLAIEQRHVTVRAGDTVEIRLGRLSRRSRMRGHLRLTSDRHVTLRDAGPFRMDGVIEPEVSVTPIFGGPSRITLHACLTDALGLVHVGQDLDAALLNVVPRARIARWAAEEFLERRGGRRDSGRVLSGEVVGFLASQSGVEYLSSRMYVPGDSLTSIDWKHTARLQSLVVKTFDDGARATGVVVVNRSVTSESEADRLVYEVLSAALTVASMSLFASLAVYDHRGDSSLSSVLDGPGLVRAALDACAGVVVAPAWRRVARPLSVQDMQARIARVKRSRGAAAPGVALLLGLRHEAVRAHLDSAVAGLLLRSASRRHAPSWCVAISAMHSDAEAVLTSLGHMEHEGIRTRLLNVGDAKFRAA